MHRQVKVRQRGLLFVHGAGINNAASSEIARAMMDELINTNIQKSSSCVVHCT